MLSGDAAQYPFILNRASSDLHIDSSRKKVMFEPPCKSNYATSLSALRWYSVKLTPSNLLCKQKSETLGCIPRILQ